MGKRKFFFLKIRLLVYTQALRWNALLTTEVPWKLRYN